MMIKKKIVVAVVGVGVVVVVVVLAVVAVFVVVINEIPVRSSSKIGALVASCRKAPSLVRVGALVRLVRRICNSALPRRQVCLQMKIGEQPPVVSMFSFGK